jgi:hypothetical protein
MLLGGSLGLTGCGPDLVADVGVLEISPDSASAGDLVTFSFVYSVAPEQWYSLVAIVDDTDVTGDRLNVWFRGQHELRLGDAADLIDQFGVGTHAGRVELRLEESGMVLSTRATAFELQ